MLTGSSGPAEVLAHTRSANRVRVPRKSAPKTLITRSRLVSSCARLVPVVGARVRSDLRRTDGAPDGSRRGKNTQFPFADLLRQSVYGRLAGYEDLNDAERLSWDPTFRLIRSEKIWERRAALSSRLQSFETEMLAEEQNFGSGLL